MSHRHSVSVCLCSYYGNRCRCTICTVSEHIDSISILAKWQCSKVNQIFVPREQNLSALLPKIPCIRAYCMTFFQLAFAGQPQGCFNVWLSKTYLQNECAFFFCTILTIEKLLMKAKLTSNPSCSFSWNICNIWNLHISSSHHFLLSLQCLCNNLTL